MSSKLCLLLPFPMFASILQHTAARPHKLRRAGSILWNNDSEEQGKISVAVILYFTKKLTHQSTDSESTSRLLTLTLSSWWMFAAKYASASCGRNMIFSWLLHLNIIESKNPLAIIYSNYSTAWLLLKCIWRFHLYFLLIMSTILAMGLCHFYVITRGKFRETILESLGKCLVENPPLLVWTSERMTQACTVVNSSHVCAGEWLFTRVRLQRRRSNSSQSWMSYPGWGAGKSEQWVFDVIPLWSDTSTLIHPSLCLRWYLCVRAHPASGDDRAPNYMLGLTVSSFFLFCRCLAMCLRRPNIWKWWLSLTTIWYVISQKEVTWKCALSSFHSFTQFISIRSEVNEEIAA